MPKICLVADIHHGAPSLTKMGPEAARLMEGFSAFCAAEAPDLVIDLGDRISDVDHQTDLRLACEAAGMFAPIAAPVRHVCGNHDRDHMTVAENAEILGQDLSNEVIELDGWTIVLFRADARITRPQGFALPEADLLWLAGVVARATRPLAVFSHVPLSGHDQTGNYYFQRNPQFSTYPQAARAREVLAGARVPVACFAGHVHWNTLTNVAGQPHFTLQSLTESFTTHPEPAGSHAVLHLGDEIVWEVHGADRFAARLPAAQSARRWVAPLPPFAEMAEIRREG